MGKIKKTISNVGAGSIAASGFAAFSALAKKDKFFEHNYVAPMSAIAPYSAEIGAAGLVSATLLAATKQYKFAAVAALAGAIALHAGQYKVINRLPKTKGNVFFEPQDIRVYVHNILTSNKDQGKKLSKQIELTNPDVIVLTEANFYSIGEAQKVLRNYLHQRWCHLGDPKWGEMNKKFDGIMIASKFPINDFVILHECGRAALSCSIQANGKKISFVAAHTSIPVNKRWAGQWVKELNALNKHIQELSLTSSHIIALGDFNATISHGPFRALVKTNNLIDVSNSAPTWPAMRAVPVLPVSKPVLGLDHILVSKTIFPVRIQKADSAGSDHLSLIADLRIL